jgi:hypothetical protein
MLSYVGKGLAMGRFHFQGVLPMFAVGFIVSKDNAEWE